MGGAGTRLGDNLDIGNLVGTRVDKCTLLRKRHRLQSQSAELHISASIPQILGAVHRAKNFRDRNQVSEWALTCGRVCSSTLVRIHTCTLRFEVRSGILGGAIRAPRTISPSTTVELKIYLRNWSDQEHTPTASQLQTAAFASEGGKRRNLQQSRRRLQSVHHEKRT